MIHLVIAKVDEVLFDGEAYSLTVPGADGDMTVLGHHMPLITTLRPGVITVRTAHIPVSEPFTCVVQSGILEVRQGGATVIL